MKLFRDRVVNKGNAKPCNGTLNLNVIFSMISCYAHKVRQKYCAKGSRETDFHPLEKVRSWLGKQLLTFL